MTLHSVPVLATPLIDVDAIRVEIELPFGLTITAMIAAALPDGGPAERSRVRVTLVTSRGVEVVEPQFWHRTRPRPGVQVVIRVIPAGKIFSSLIQIFVTVAALALGQFWFPGLAATTLGKAVIGLAASAVGSLVARAFVKPPEQDKRRDRYTISGIRNEIRLDGVIPYPFGTIRWTPPFAVAPYSVIRNGEQYVRLALLAGYGEQVIDEDDIRIGETPWSKYDHKKIEIMPGVAGDPTSTIITETVIERLYRSELTRPRPRDQYGEIIDGEAIETPVVRYSARDAKTLRVILWFGGGLCSVDDEGGLRELTVEVRIRMRPADSTGDWTDVVVLTIAEATRTAFFREHVWDVPVRGAYAVEITRMTPERRSTQAQDTMTLLAIQSILPEYPLNFSEPMALVIAEIKATYQLSDTLDPISILSRRKALDWNHLTEAWEMRETRSPASALRQVLQRGTLFPEDDAGINLPQIEDWHDLCRVRGYTYDRVHDFEAKRDEVLEAIAAVGMAAPRFDGVREGVVIDNPAALPIIDHIDSRTADGFESTREYIDPPHAFVVEFLDETNDYKPAKRIVRWPGYTGDITVTERLELPGLTDPAQVWRAARRRQLEFVHRADDYKCVQTGTARIATRGSKVRVASPVLSTLHRAARVRQISGGSIVLDDDVRMTNPEGTYAVAYKVGGEDGDAAGTSIIRQVKTVTGTTRVLRMLEADSRLTVGMTVHFGPMSAASTEKIVTRVEAGQELTTILHMVDAAPQIDTILAATEVPAWSSRLGTEVPTITEAPDAPVFARILSGVKGTASANGLTVRMRQATTGGDVHVFQVQHRGAGDTVWNTISIPAGSSSTAIAGYVRGDSVQLRARGVAKDGTTGAYTDVVTVVIGSLDPGAPLALDGAAISITGGLGMATVSLRTGADLNTSSIAIWRAAGVSLNKETDVLVTTIDVAPRRNYTVTDGDPGLVNMLDADEEGNLYWRFDDGWRAFNGSATHSTSGPGVLSFSIPAASGSVYRIGWRIRRITAGTVKARLSGSPNVDGAEQSTTGRKLARLASTGQGALSLVGSADYAGEIDSIVAYIETPACLSQGTARYFFEPLNSIGEPGPLSGPHTVTII
ncbi:TipJ family phage tail tip protein [Ensifer soli]|uniref:TipJ family phage tail tip protein n=1 Tax=Ciceribacter sp. sgz301302 TaxID=3342379 RepID=UPI0035BB1544